ncbi:sce7725 family protein [Janibacter hoylei]|uniref:sce7725 family protein n=1 Tax=Janibacter hoylei TaxID=364298 RepID=UPI00248F4AC0|nr:sce7725 family protein [Janibacter hoylei]
MYFPYLRGKQYELLSLKELAPTLGRSRKVIPVIEPVKSSDGGLQRCTSTLMEAGVRPIIVTNPRVGELRGRGISSEVQTFIEAQEVAPRLALLIDEDTEVTPLMEDYSNRYGDSHSLTLIHDQAPADLLDLDVLLEESAQLGREFDLISDNLRDRHYRRFKKAPGSVAAIMHDGFTAADRNADYLSRAESVFSDDLLYFREDGYGGFGDYLTVGHGWQEGGFTPRAVAIHWTYQPEPGSPIRIRHFTSESNGSVANVGGKFLEAADKLIRFLDEENIQSNASQVMRRHASNRTYPGLGIVKKLSIQNHLELMTGILENL